MSAPALTARALLLVATGGVLGALARYLVAGYATRGSFPWGTALVNVTGSLAIGLFLFGGTAKGYFGPDARVFFAVGFLGAYTTMSTFTYETVAMMEDGEWGRAAGNFLLNPVLCLAGCYLGRGLAYLIPPQGA
ncbi:MAG: fluoride efflux transporter CrcB [Thermoplasmatota archaeon]